MSEIAADAYAFRQSFARRTGWARLGITESKTLIDEVADRLNFCPAARYRAEIRPGEIRHEFGLAISARTKKWERIGRQVRHRRRFRCHIDLIRTSIGSENALKTQ